MFWKTNKDTTKQLNNIHSLLHNSFNNVKKDTQNIFAWLTYLYKKTQHQEQIIYNLNKQLNQMPSSPEAIKKVIDTHYSYNNLFNRIEELKKRIEELHFEKVKEQTSLNIQIKEIQKKLEELEQLQNPLQNHSKILELNTKLEEIHKSHSHDHIHNKLDQITTRIDTLEQKHEKYTKNKSYIREKIIKKITKNSKDYVKNLMLSLIRKYNQISALQLREIVVEEQGLCSKSSFYRLLEEIENEDEVDVLAQGKEKKYISKLVYRQ